MLPKLTVPEYSTKIPSTGEEFRYRPFLVGEEKILYMALEGGGLEELANAVASIIEKCALSPIETKTLTSYDVEYLFLKMRAKSVGEIIELRVGHKPQNPCVAKTKVEVDVDSIRVDVDPKRTGLIQLRDGVGIKLRDPSYRLSLVEQQSKGVDGQFAVILSSVEQIYGKEETYTDFTRQELSDFFDTLNKSELAKIREFFETTPKLQHEIKFKCSSCGQEDTVVLEGMQSFFTSD